MAIVSVRHSAADLLLLELDPYHLFAYHCQPSFESSAGGNTLSRYLRFAVLRERATLSSDDRILTAKSIILIVIVACASGISRGHSPAE